MSSGLPLLDLMRPVYMRWPIDGDGHVISGEPLETLELRGADAVKHVRIELHPSEDGRWMWAVQWHLSARGGGYKVGPKWGRFAASRAAALAYAAEELIARMDDSGPADPFIAKVRAWCAGLKAEAA